MMTWYTKPIFTLIAFIAFGSFAEAATICCDRVACEGGFTTGDYYHTVKGEWSVVPLTPSTPPPLYKTGDDRPLSLAVRMQQKDCSAKPGYKPLAIGCLEARNYTLFLDPLPPTTTTETEHIPKTPLTAAFDRIRVLATYHYTFDLNNPSGPIVIAGKSSVESNLTCNNGNL